VFPFHLCVGLFFLDGLDRVCALLFFAVDHDDFDACEGEGSADFIAVHSQWLSEVPEGKTYPIPSAPPVTTATLPFKFSGWTSLGPTTECRTDCIVGNVS
jgi:hypothetical protein